jgi:hypothetical protein
VLAIDRFIKSHVSAITNVLHKNFQVIVSFSEFAKTKRYVPYSIPINELLLRPSGTDCNKKFAKMFRDIFRIVTIPPVFSIGKL